MAKIIETENFTVNADGSLRVIVVTEYTESTEEPYIINQTITNDKNFVDRNSYKAQKENIMWEGKMEMERGTEKVLAAEKILNDLGK